MHYGSYLRASKYLYKVVDQPFDMHVWLAHVFPSYKSSIYSYTPRFLEYSSSNQFVQIKLIILYELLEILRVPIITFGKSFLQIIVYTQVN